MSRSSSGRKHRAGGLRTHAFKEDKKPAIDLEHSEGVRELRQKYINIYKNKNKKKTTRKKRKTRDEDARRRGEIKGEVKWVK